MSFNSQGTSLFVPPVPTTAVPITYLNYTGTKSLYNYRYNDLQESQLEIGLPRAADLGIPQSHSYQYNRFVLQRWTEIGFFNQTKGETSLEVTRSHGHLVVSYCQQIIDKHEIICNFLSMSSFETDSFQ